MRVILLLAFLLSASAQAQSTYCEKQGLPSPLPFKFGMEFTQAADILKDRPNIQVLSTYSAFRVEFSRAYGQTGRLTTTLGFENRARVLTEYADEFTLPKEEGVKLKQKLMAHYDNFFGVKAYKVAEYDAFVLPAKGVPLTRHEWPLESQDGYAYLDEDIAGVEHGDVHLTIRMGCGYIRQKSRPSLLPSD